MEPLDETKMLAPGEDNQLYWYLILKYIPVQLTPMLRYASVGLAQTSPNNTKLPVVYMNKQLYRASLLAQGNFPVSFSILVYSISLVPMSFIKKKKTTTRKKENKCPCSQLTQQIFWNESELLMNLVQICTPKGGSDTELQTESVSVLQMCIRSLRAAECDCMAASKG